MASATHGRRDAFGSILGIVTFLGGVGLLLLTFREAFSMFETPPRDALGIGNSKVLEPTTVGNGLMTIVIRIALLLIMGIVASLITNKGIHLYTECRGRAIKHEVKAEESPE